MEEFQICKTAVIKLIDEISTSPEADKLINEINDFMCLAYFSTSSIKPQSSMIFKKWNKIHEKFDDFVKTQECPDDLRVNYQMRMNDVDSWLRKHFKN